MHRTRLVSYLARVDPQLQTDRRLRLRARVNRLATIRESAAGAGAPLSDAETLLVDSLLATLRDDLALGREGRETLAAVTGDGFVAKFRSRLDHLAVPPPRLG